METYLRQQGAQLSGRVKVLTFDEIAARQEIPLGTYIFGAIDHFSRTEKQIAERCCQKLSQADPAIRLINRPSEVISRYELLSRSFEMRRNSFRVARVSRLHRFRNFPAFIRSERRHEGSLTPLLHTRGQVALGVTKLLLRGHPWSDLMLVEYCHTADFSGVFREYCASIVGDRIIPQALVHSREWVTKWHGRLVDAKKAREEREYVESNPHGEWLKETFDLAHVRYGRIDYGLHDDRPQVWEINTNPLIVRPTTWAPRAATEEEKRLGAPVVERFLQELHDALKALESPADPNQTLRVNVSSEEQRSLRAEKRWLIRGKQWNPLTGDFSPK